MQENRENLKAFFFSWSTNFVERVVRLRQYLSERLASIPSGSKVPDMLNDLLKENDELADRLRDVVLDLFSSTPDEVARYWTNYYSALRGDIPKAFRKLHRQLWLIPAPWPRPELDLFVQAVLQTAGYEDLVRWALLVTGDYNFSDILVTEPEYSDFRHALGETKRESSFGTPRPIRDALTIPAAERENPVAWLNLIHELGHFVGLAHGIVERANTLPSVMKFQSKDARIYNRLSEHWVPEIIADLVATDLLGIGYYTSFVQFATYWAEESVRIPILTHPPVEARRQYIYERLRDLDAVSEDSRNTLDEEYNVRLTLDNEDISVRHNIFDDRRDRYDWETELKKMAKEIVSLEEYQRVLHLPSDSADIDFLWQLAKQIDRGWVIASKPAEFRKRSIDEVEAKLKEAKLELTQVGNNVKDIITAASLTRLYSTRRMASSTSTRGVADAPQSLLRTFVEEPNTPIRSRLMHLWSDIHKLDIIITKSIEAAAIMKFYQTSKIYAKVVEK